MSNLVLFGSQVFAGHGWPGEPNHRGPVRSLDKTEKDDVKNRVPPELRSPAIRYTVGVGFRCPAELFRHIDVDGNWNVRKIDFHLLFRLAVGHLYTRPTGLNTAKEVHEVRASKLPEMKRLIKAAFGDIEMPVIKGAMYTKLSGFPVAVAEGLTAPAAKVTDCRKRQCGASAEFPGYGGVLCDHCRRNELKIGIDIGSVLDANASKPPELVAAMAKPGWLLGVCGHPIVWFQYTADGNKVDWSRCVARGRFLASGLLLDEAAWICTTGRAVDITLVRALVPEGNAVVRFAETQAAVKLALRLDRGPANAGRICEELRRNGIARGPLLLNVDTRPDMAHYGIGAYHLRTRNLELHACGITIMALADKTPVVAMSHAAAALARLLKVDTRGIPCTFSVYDGRKLPNFGYPTVRIDAAVGFEDGGLEKTLARMTSNAVVVVENAHALTFGMLYYIVQTPASIVFSGSAVGKYGFTHAGYKRDLGQAWYCVVAAAAHPASGATIVTATEADFDDASLRGMLARDQIGPCPICESDADGRDHVSDLVSWALLKTKPKWHCSAEAVLRGRSVDQAAEQAESSYQFLKSAVEYAFS